MLSPQQTAVTSWPIAADVPDLNAIIDEQAAAIAANAALIDSYQETLSDAIDPQPGLVATATGTSNGNQISFTAVTNQIVQGATLSDPNNVTIPQGTTILGQINGTPNGAGLYLTSGPTTANATAITITPPPVPQSWPTPQDQVTLNLIAQQQIAVLRVQSALIQHYQDLLTTSQTPPL